VADRVGVLGLANGESLRDVFLRVLGAESHLPAVQVVQEHVVPGELRLVHDLVRVAIVPKLHELFEHFLSIEGCHQ
jgi:hypothetical protein